MNTTEAKEYIFGLISTIKLTEKEIQSLEEEAAKWKNRIALASSKGDEALLREAEKETERINSRLVTLMEERQSFRNDVEKMQRDLPGIAARERTVDADLLGQELLMALGQTEEEVKAKREFEKMEKDDAVQTALENLKAKLKGEADS